MKVKINKFQLEKKNKFQLEIIIIIITKMKIIQQQSSKSEDFVN